MSGYPRSPQPVAKHRTGIDLGETVQVVASLAGGFMDILARLKAEESELRQQLDTIRAAIRIVKAENKALCKKTNGVSAPRKKNGLRAIPQR
jgi:hypothetical protein